MTCLKVPAKDIFEASSGLLKLSNGVRSHAKVVCLVLYSNGAVKVVKLSVTETVLYTVLYCRYCIGCCPLDFEFAFAVLEMNTELVCRRQWRRQGYRPSLWPGVHKSACILEQLRFLFITSATSHVSGGRLFKLGMDEVFVTLLKRCGIPE